MVYRASYSPAVNMKWLIITALFLTGCTVVIWSDNVTVTQDVESDDMGIDPFKKRITK